MSDQSIDVRIRANTSDLKPAMDGAAQSVEAASARMRKAAADAATNMQGAFARMKEQMAGVGAGIREPMQSAAEGLKESAIAMTGNLQGVVQAMTALPGPAMAAAAAMVAVFAGNKFAAAAADSIEATMTLARVLGSSTNEAEKWRVALDDVGATQGELEGAAKGMARQLRENEADMNKLGLTTRDAAGQLRPLTDLMAEGIGIVTEYKEGVDRAQVAQTVFGRGVDAASNLLLLNQDTLQSSQETMQKFGLEVGANAVAAWNEFDAAGDTAAIGLKGIGYTIGAIVMPVITDLINACNSLIPAAITVLRGAIGGLVTAFSALQNGVVVVFETINAMVITVAEPVRALAEAIGRAVTGDFAGAAAAITGIGSNIGNAWGAAMTRITDSSAQTKNRIAAIWNPDEVAGESIGSRGTKNALATKKDAKEKGAKAVADPSMMQAYEAELAARRLAYAKENDLREMSKTEEKAYWDSILAMTDVNAKDRAAISIKTATLELAVLRDKAKEGRAITLLEVEQVRARGLESLKISEQDAQTQLALGNITQEQRLQAQAAFEAARYEIELQAQQERIRLVEMDPNSNPVELAKQKAQLLEIEAAYQLKKKEIQSQLVIQKAGPEMDVFKSMEASFSQSITSMLTQGQTLRQGLSGIFKSIFGIFSQEMVAKPIAMTAMRVIRESALYQALFGAQVATQAAASGTVAGIKSTEATAVVGANATEAASGAAASQAAIPIAGPALAVAAAAAMLAFVMGMGGGGKGGGTSSTTTSTRMPSASKGYDIPAGVNPVTQLHEKEMVLPSRQADVIRSLADSGGGGGQVVMHISTPDADSFRRSARQIQRAQEQAFSRGRG